MQKATILLALAVMFMFGCDVGKEAKKRQAARVEYMHRDAGKKANCPYSKVKTATRDGRVYLIDACGTFFTYKCERGKCNAVPNGYQDPANLQVVQGCQ